MARKMTYQQALKIALEAMEKAQKNMHVDANLHDLLHVETHHCVNMSKKRKKIREAMEILREDIAPVFQKQPSFPLPHPVEAIKFRMEQQDLKPVDLVPALGSRAKVSEILNLHRKLTLSQIQNLVAQFGIPAKVLVQDYEVTPYPSRQP